MRIALCGGTFDPFHRGHLDPVLAARRELRWERIVYVVASRQPFKRERDTAPAAHRFAMAAIATLPYDGIEVSDFEIERGEISYTIDTLAHFRQQHPEADLDWIIGDDNVEGLPRWRDAARLFELARFVVLTRQGTRAIPPELQARANGGRLVFVHNETVPVSSTEIRRKIRAEEPIDGMVDPLVSRYIEHYRLYREAQ
jgi:nicotinate-nucleotide adenylyltransferase